MKDRLLVFNVVDIIKRTKNVLIAVVRHTFSCYHESRPRCKFFEFFSYLKWLHFYFYDFIATTRFLMLEGGRHVLVQFFY